MQATAPQSWNGLGPLSASAILHLLAILAVILLHLAPVKPAAPESTISVELLPADNFPDNASRIRTEAPREAEPSQDAPSQSHPADSPSAEKQIPKDRAEDRSPHSEPQPSVMPQDDSGEVRSKPLIRASHFYASEVLKNPKSKGAARDLRSLGPEERMIQLCNLEAMEQVSHWRTHIKADFLVSYAMADTRREGQKIIADGAAVRSKGHWFNLKYSCVVTPDQDAVDAFEFVLGDEIPETEWASHSLPYDENFDD